MLLLPILMHCSSARGHDYKLLHFLTFLLIYRSVDVSIAIVLRINGRKIFPTLKICYQLASTQSKRQGMMFSLAFEIGAAGLAGNHQTDGTCAKGSSNASWVADLGWAWQGHALARSCRVQRTSGFVRWWRQSFTFCPQWSEVRDQELTRCGPTFKGGEMCAQMRVRPPCSRLLLFTLLELLQLLPKQLLFHREVTGYSRSKWTLDIQISIFTVVHLVKVTFFFLRWIKFSTYIVAVAVRKRNSK